MEKLKFGLIGGGMAGPLTAKALTDIPHAELVAFCDLNSDLFAKYEEYGAENFYTDYQNMLKQKDIDVICIATPPFHHKEAVIAASKAGKHVIVEKPIAINLMEADEMIESCKQAQVKLGVISMYRFMKPAKIIKKALEEDKLGKIISASCIGKSYRDNDYYDMAKWRGTWWGEGGGSLISQTIHFIDLLIYFLGDVDLINGQYRTAIHPDIEVDDVAIANLTMKNGAIANIYSSTAVQPGYPRRLEIHGKKGTIILEEEKIIEWKVQGMDETKYLTKEEKNSGDTSSKAGFINSEYHQEQIEDFILSLQENGKTLIDGLEGRRTLEVIRGIYQSGDLGKTVKLPVQDSKKFGRKHLIK